MAVSYKKLWFLLVDRNEICKCLDCKIDDITDVNGASI